MSRRALTGAVCGLMAAGCVGGSSPIPAPTGRQVTQADYERIERGMTRQQVEAVLGPAEPATADEILGPVPPGAQVPALEHRRQALAQLHLTKWGSESSWVYAGFARSGEVRVRAMRLQNGSSVESGFELIGAISVGSDGRVALMPDGTQAPVPAAPKSTDVPWKAAGGPSKPKSAPAPKPRNPGPKPKAPAPKPKTAPADPKTELGEGEKVLADLEKAVTGWADALRQKDDATAGEKKEQFKKLAVAFAELPESDRKGSLPKYRGRLQQAWARMGHALADRNIAPLSYHAEIKKLQAKMPTITDGRDMLALTGSSILR